MKKIIALLTIFVFVFLNGIAMAGDPPGLKKKGKTPKGFTQGEKKGWHGDLPNGWSKMSKEEKEEWLKEKGLDPEEYEQEIEYDDEEGVEDYKEKKKHKKEKKAKKKSSKK